MNIEVFNIRFFPVSITDLPIEYLDIILETVYCDLAGRAHDMGLGNILTVEVGLLEAVNTIKISLPDGEVVVDLKLNRPVPFLAGELAQSITPELRQYIRRLSIWFFLQTFKLMMILLASDSYPWIMYASLNGPWHPFTIPNTVSVNIVSPYGIPWFLFYGLFSLPRRDCYSS